MLAGDPYVVDEELAADLTRASRLAHQYNEAYGRDPESARPILEKLLGSIAADAYVRAPLTVDYGAHITIGPGTFVNSGLTALDVAPITIGADVQIGPQVQLLTPKHPIDPEQRRRKLEWAEPIVIGDNVWLGGGVIVLGGVTIGENSVIGAGAVVTRDVPPNVVAVGNPARVLREIPGS
ncbi:sugar O-acetyltransferase [Thermocatellispora tengchongensis]|nr:sugar O-acetyltransferase [Thermocatellispora tengchongensis]